MDKLDTFNNAILAMFMILKPEFAVIGGLWINYVLKINKLNEPVSFIIIFKLTTLGFFTGLYVNPILIKYLEDVELANFILFLIGLFYMDVYEFLIQNVNALLEFIAKKFF
jgi:hypothetical protein